jgi:hypothetical protein
MRIGALAALLGGCVVLAGCGNTGRVMGGVVAGASAVGSMALGLASTAAGAGVSAAGSLAGAGVQAAGAVVAPAAGAVGTASATQAAGTPTDPVGSRADGVEPAAQSASGGGGDATAVAALGSAGAALLGLQILEAAGQQAVPRAQDLLSKERRPVDRCALQVFLGVAGTAGHAQGARFAVWLGDRARDHGQSEALASLIRLADEIADAVRAQAQQVRLSAAEILGVDSEDSVQDSLGIANDLKRRCPASAARRLTELLEEEPGG